MVRSKYGTIPIPNSEVTLDGDTLRGEATAEKDQLIEQLREMLDQTVKRHCWKQIESQVIHYKKR